MLPTDRLSSSPYELSHPIQPSLGLITLQTDNTIEDDFRQLLSPHKLSLLHTRIPMQDNINEDSLREMSEHFEQALKAFPEAHAFDAIGYGCTSASLLIGDAALENLIRPHVKTRHVTNPFLAVKRTLKNLPVKRLGYLSPYNNGIAIKMIEALRQEGIDIPCAATFNATKDSIVSRINASSITAAVTELSKKSQLDAIFIACTALKCTPLLPQLSKTLGIPVLSSNQLLAHDLLTLTHTKSHLL